MQISRRALGLAAAAMALGLAFLQYRESRPTPRSATPLVMPAHDESQVRDRDIEFYSRRLVEDPSSALDRSSLARLLFSRAGSTGSAADLEHAERLVRESIAERPQRNYGAFQLLATLLMERHDFHAARDIALRLDSLDPRTPSHLALLGEIELELGDYDAATSRFDVITWDGRSLTTGARLARWYEVTGRAGKARYLLKRMAIAADRRDDLPREQAAWFHYRLGELELRLGNVSAAESTFVRGLARNPGDVRILGGLAHAALTRGAWHDAIDYGKRATVTRLDPATLGIVSVAYAKLGDTAQAASYARASSASARQQPGPIDREWALFLLDYGTPQERAEVLERARQELRERKDVYGHDLMAWALYRNGRVDEARKQIQLALSQNTQDVLLFEHARAIATLAAATSQQTSQ